MRIQLLAIYLGNNNHNKYEKNNILIHLLKSEFALRNVSILVERDAALFKLISHTFDSLLSLNSRPLLILYHFQFSVPI